MFNAFCEMCTFEEDSHDYIVTIIFLDLGVVFCRKKAPHTIENHFETLKGGAFCTARQLPLNKQVGITRPLPPEKWCLGDLKGGGDVFFMVFLQTK